VDGIDRCNLTHGHEQYISYGSYKMNTCFLVLQFSCTRFGCDYLAEAVTLVTEHLVSGKCFAEIHHSQYYAILHI